MNNKTAKLIGKYALKMKKSKRSLKKNWNLLSRTQRNEIRKKLEADLKQF